MRSVDVTAEFPPDRGILITPTVLEVLQRLVGQHLSFEEIDQVRRQDWILVCGEVAGVSYGANQELAGVHLQAANGNQTILLASDQGNDSLGFRDDPDLPRIVVVQNLAAFQVRFEEAAVIDRQTVSCICEVSTQTLKVLTLHAPEPLVLTPDPATAPTEAELPPPLRIELRDQGALTANQRSIFEMAARRWGEVLRNPWPPIPMGPEQVDGVIVTISVRALDGENGIFGRSAPTLLRPDSRLPVTGLLEVDPADLARLENEGSLMNVALHELAHALGFGSLWPMFNLLQQSGAADPVYIGAAAMREYAQLIGSQTSQPVPVENTGDQLIRNGHWRETVFGDELMSGFLSGEVQPLSRVTIAAFADLGYVVNYAAAHTFDLPTPADLDALDFQGGQRQCCKCRLGLAQLGNGQLNVALADAVPFA